MVNSGTLRFNVVSGAAAIGTGVTATIASGATLELAGSVSALSSGGNRVNITNNSSSPGILVSGTNQQVGNIDGAGTTQVNAGSDLTANHIIQSALCDRRHGGEPRPRHDRRQRCFGQSTRAAQCGRLAAVYDARLQAMGEARSLSET